MSLRQAQDRPVEGLNQSFLNMVVQPTFGARRKTVGWNDKLGPVLPMCHRTRLVSRSTAPLAFDLFLELLTAGFKLNLSGAPALLRTCANGTPRNSRPC
jgi:hypothetical protein